MNFILNPIVPLVRLAGLLVVILLFTVDLKAQSPVTHQYYLKLEESAKHIDPSYCVMECTSDSPEIFIQLFNEAPGAQTLDFTITVSDGTKTPVDYNVKGYKLAAAEMVNPVCGSSDHSGLRFNVPAGFDPAKLKVEISYP